MPRLVLLWLLTWSGLSLAQVQLLATGLQAGAPVKKLPRTGWLVFTSEGLEPARVTFDVARDPVHDDGKPEAVKTGLDVRSTPEGAVLVRGLAPRKSASLLPPGQTVGLNRPGQALTLGTATLRVEQKDARSALVLSVGGVEQTLFQQNDGDLDGWNLRWAGDLDGDGKLDLLLDADSHYARQTTRLFLSSKASGRLLVKQVAHLTATGA